MILTTDEDLELVHRIRRGLRRLATEHKGIARLARRAGFHRSTLWRIVKGGVPRGATARRLGRFIK